MQKPHQMVVDLNTLMFANRIRPGDACRRARVNASTWSRWAAGGTPDVLTHDRLKLAVEEMIAEQESQPAA